MKKEIEAKLVEIDKEGNRIVTIKYKGQKEPEIRKIERI